MSSVLFHLLQRFSYFTKCASLTVSYPSLTNYTQDSSEWPMKREAEGRSIIVSEVSGPNLTNLP